jgi:membrane-associated phospholipid phosphatase
LTRSESPQAIVADAAPPTRQESAGNPAQSGVSALFRLFGAIVSCALLVAVSIAFVDRPVATWVHEHLGVKRFVWFSTTYFGPKLAFGPFGLMASPAAVFPMAAALLFVALALAAYAGWRLGKPSRIVLALCVAVFAANEIVSFVKGMFGRTWPESWLGDNPSWIRDGVFGFFPFHGGADWASFPSGHMAIVTAAATLLWVVWPDLRIAWAGLVAVVAIGLIAGNYHFASDVIAGLYFGAGVGLGVAALMLSQTDEIELHGRPGRGRSYGANSGAGPQRH